MNSYIKTISNRMSLRKPQKESLEIFEKAVDQLSLNKITPIEQELASIQQIFPEIKEFERDFPCLCFSLATGVGKTRLMGAFIAYLHKVKGIKNFLILAPNLTIYNKLRSEFVQTSKKYIFEGLIDFTIDQPIIIDGENYKTGVGIRNLHRIQKEFLFDNPKDDRVYINIFNISKLANSSDKREIKKLSEYLGKSYYEYLCNLSDLVIFMDEAHRYRASAGMATINELNPILGIELTATPYYGSSEIKFKNIIYDYSLSSAILDGFVKQPAIAGRQDFEGKTYSEEIENLKLEDSIKIHETTKAHLEIYALENKLPRIKPFILIIAQDTSHANELYEKINSERFFMGAYKNKVLVTHSCQKPEEEELVINQLLNIESNENPVEIVIHVKRLAEGWDVNNLYTIVPLRAANTKNLIFQSLGRGLRLPYGKLTGEDLIDTLTIVSHDRFNEIIDEANKPNSIIRKKLVIGKDIPEDGCEIVKIQSRANEKLIADFKCNGYTEQDCECLLETIQETIEESEHNLEQEETIEVAIQKAKCKGIEIKESTLTDAFQMFKENQISIPIILVQPKEAPYITYKDFDLNLKNFYPQKMDNIIIKTLADGKEIKIENKLQTYGNEEERLEDTIILDLINYKSDVSYEKNSTLLYKLSAQMISHIRSYVKDELEIKNILLSQKQTIIEFIYQQLLNNSEEKKIEYQVSHYEGYTTYRKLDIPVAKHGIRNYIFPLEQKCLIRSFLFNGFSKCLYSHQQFHSDPERRFSIVLEKEESKVLKWFKASKSHLKIYYDGDTQYIPDFIVETENAKYLIEIKSFQEMNSEDVKAKTNAALLWCFHANSISSEKKWSYILIPDTAVKEDSSFERLVTQYKMKSEIYNYQETGNRLSE